MNAMLLPAMMEMLRACYVVSFIDKNVDVSLHTTFEIAALTFRLPIEIPEPAWLHTKFSTRT